MRYIIAHGHIFKNAGTTFDSALKIAFGKGFCDHRDDVSMRKGGADYLDRFILENPQIKAISSHHLCNPLPISKEYQCIPVYFVRNPLERVISVYNFERKQKVETLGAQHARKLNLKEYVEWRMSDNAPKIISNYQTAYIGSEELKRPDQIVESNEFLNVVKKISNDEILVGVVDRFQESFLYIASALSKYFPDTKFNYNNRNISNKKSDYEKYQESLELLSPIVEELLASNAYDMALYMLASSKVSFKG